MQYRIKWCGLLWCALVLQHVCTSIFLDINYEDYVTAHVPQCCLPFEKIQNPFLLLIIFYFSNPLPNTGNSRCPCLANVTFCSLLLNADDSVFLNRKASPAAKIGKGHPNVLFPPLKLHISWKACSFFFSLKTIPDQ
uniref:Secreted protein n=1 Tax=Micrurus corallinus TaxID=54390 RepID=A0A2D4GT09_MICCO